MTKSKLVSVMVLFLGLSTFASAKSFSVKLSNSGENADGNFSSPAIDHGVQNGTTVYELVPATAEIAQGLKSSKCPVELLVEGSVLSRTQSFDDENQRPGLEKVKLLVRDILCPTR
jgi:hypothetical protein